MQLYCYTIMVAYSYFSQMHCMIDTCVPCLLLTKTGLACYYNTAKP